MMVGEIRDNETADIAVKAALTGHQVLEHAAHERRRRRDHASRRHGDRAVPDFQLGHHDLRATTRAARLHELPRRIYARSRKCSSGSGLKPTPRARLLPRQRLRPLQGPRLSRPARDHRSAAGKRGDPPLDHQARLRRGDQEPGCQRRDENVAHGRASTKRSRASRRWRKSGASRQRITKRMTNMTIPFLRLFQERQGHAPARRPKPSRRRLEAVPPFRQAEQRTVEQDRDAERDA